MKNIVSLLGFLTMCVVLVLMGLLGGYGITTAYIQEQLERPKGALCEITLGDDTYWIARFYKMDPADRLWVDMQTGQKLGSGAVPEPMSQDAISNDPARPEDLPPAPR